jgi:FlaA1/EpsC-like NDP-sugar epimerase
MSKIKRGDFMTKERSQILIRKTCLVAFDILSVIIAFFLSSIIAYNGHIELSFLRYSYYLLSGLIISSLIFFVLLRLYDSLWRYASVNELLNVIIASFLSTIVYCILCTICPVTPPISTVFLYLLILLMLVGGARFGYRFLRLYASRHHLLGRGEHIESRVMIIGAGSAGEKILRETLVTPKINKEVVCFIDDDLSKKGRRIHNVPVVGGRNEILQQAEKYHVDEIYIALPSIDDKEVSEVLNICKETKCKLKKLPGIYQFLNDEITLEKLKDVEVQDLLGRNPIKVNLEEIMGYVQDKVVMVTGGGGSIGSELCRQIAKSHPKQLIIVDIYENNAYDIQLELQRKYPKLNLETMIASVRDQNKINDLFAYYHPDIVYHAAAHKHVPLMEDAPHEAIKNNVFGTLNVAKAADQYGVKKFILISIDKAVNPTNIMVIQKDYVK